MSLGLKLNWLKTNVQALGSMEDEPSTITVLGREPGHLAPEWTARGGL